MYCLFFDVTPKPGHLEAYFDHVARLKPVLERHEGLLYLERFRPLDAPEALLSHQLWRDEAAIDAWRRDASHRASQAAGQRLHFEGYRIRVGRDCKAAENGPSDRFIVASYGDARAPDAQSRSYESVTRPGVFLRLTDTTRPDRAARAIEDAQNAGAETVRLFRLIRDYTMTDRAEAPQPAA